MRNKSGRALQGLPVCGSGVVNCDASYLIWQTKNDNGSDTLITTFLNRAGLRALALSSRRAVQMENSVSETPPTGTRSRRESGDGDVAPQAAKKRKK